MKLDKMTIIIDTVSIICSTYQYT